MVAWAVVSSSFSFRLVRCHAYGATASIPVGSRGSLSLYLQIIVAMAHTSIVGGTRGMLTVPQSHLDDFEARLRPARCTSMKSHAQHRQPWPELRRPGATDCLAHLDKDSEQLFCATACWRGMHERMKTMSWPSTVNSPVSQLVSQSEAQGLSCSEGAPVPR